MTAHHDLSKIFKKGFKNYSPDEIKNLRSMMDMTQTEFGQLFFAEACTVRGWEKGRRTPECSTMRLLQMVEIMANERENNINHRIRKAYR